VRAARPAAPRTTTNGGKEATAGVITAAERGRLRREELRARRKQESRKRNLLIAGIAALIIAVVGGGLWYKGEQERQFEARLGIERFADQGNTHIDEGATYAEYNSNPPTSGPHYNRIHPWGISDTRVANELQLHNLEDGGVVIQYKPDLATADVDKLKAIVGRYEEQVLLAPNETLEQPIVVTAWTRMLRLDAYDEAKVVEFIEAYRGIDHHKPGQG
jgi:hypothetical protein